jgi:site-specific recombinase XerD
MVRPMPPSACTPGTQWTNTGLVFTTELGGPVDPRNLLRAVEIAAAKAGVEGVGVHTLRHSAAVAWLESGVHIKAVADVLGHSSISVTGERVRTHVRCDHPGRDRPSQRSARALTAVLRRGE